MNQQVISTTDSHELLISIPQTASLSVYSNNFQYEKLIVGPWSTYCWT